MLNSSAGRCQTSSNLSLRYEVSVSRVFSSHAAIPTDTPRERTDKTRNQLSPELAGWRGAEISMISWPRPPGRLLSCSRFLCLMQGRASSFLWQSGTAWKIFIIRPKCGCSEVTMRCRGEMACFLLPLLSDTSIAMVGKKTIELVEDALAWSGGQWWPPLTVPRNHEFNMNYCEGTVYYSTSTKPNQDLPPIRTNQNKIRTWEMVRMLYKVKLLTCQDFIWCNQVLFQTVKLWLGMRGAETSFSPWPVPGREEALKAYRYFTPSKNVLSILILQWFCEVAKAETQCSAAPSS